MISFEQRCRSLIDKVRKDFPELNGIKIHLKIKKLKKGSMWANKILYLYYLIKIDPEKYFDAKDKEMIGAIAHELVHLEDFKKMSFLEWVISYIKYHIFKKYAQKMELDTDKIVIKKDYARELFLNRKYRLSRIPKKEFKKIRGNYLAPEEIKSYARKIRRW